jgi:peroxin-7
MPSFAFHPGFAGNSIRFNPWSPTEFLIGCADNFGVSGSGKLYVVKAEPNGIQCLSALATSDSITDACFAEVGKPSIVVTACGDGLKIFDLAALKPGFQPEMHIVEHAAELSSVMWNQCRQETFASASWDHSVRVWAAGRPGSIFVGMEHLKEVYEANWSPRDPNILLSCSGDGFWKLWDIRQGGRSSLSTPGHQGQMIMTVDWNKYDQNIIATGGVDRMVKIWDLRRPQREVLGCPGHQGTVRRVRFSPHSRTHLLSSGYDFRVCLWDLDRPAAKQHPLVHRYEQHREFVCGVEWSTVTPDHVASVGWDGLAYFWQLGAPIVPTHAAQPPLPMIEPPPRPPGASKIIRRGPQMPPPPAVAMPR